PRDDAQLRMSRQHAPRIRLRPRHTRADPPKVVEQFRLRQLAFLPGINQLKARILQRRHIRPTDAGQSSRPDQHFWHGPFRQNVLELFHSNLRNHELPSRRDDWQVVFNQEPSCTEKTVVSCAAGWYDIDARGLWRIMAQHPERVMEQGRTVARWLWRSSFCL